MTLGLLGNLVIAIGSSAQAARWLTTEAGRLRDLRGQATSRVERLVVKRQADRASTDWAVWTAIAVGSWLIVFSEVF